MLLDYRFGEGAGLDSGSELEVVVESMGFETTSNPRLLAEGASPVETLDPGTSSKTSISRPWNVIVWNDPITLMSYVVLILQKLFGYNRERATQLMLEVHQKGRSVVASVDREKAEYYVSRLHGHGLQASLEEAG